jgi:hypothetical protein
MSPHTIPYPEAMVVESLNAHLTFFAMLGSIVASDLTLIAKMLFRLFLAQQTIFALIIYLFLFYLFCKLDLPKDRSCIYFVTPLIKF